MKQSMAIFNNRHTNGTIIHTDLKKINTGVEVK